MENEMSTKPVRNTKKSRIIAELSEAIIDQYLTGDNAISKGEIVAMVITNNIGSEASTAIRVMLEDEIANELDRYFYEVVKIAAEAIGRPHHLVTNKYFKQENLVKSKYTAQQMVCVFGNGRMGKAAGVRFVPEGVTNDPYLAIAMEKDFCRVKGVNKGLNDRVEEATSSGALTGDTIKKLK
jgi:hypothetical protein